MTFNHNHLRIHDEINGAIEKKYRNFSPINDRHHNIDKSVKKYIHDYMNRLKNGRDIFLNYPLWYRKNDTWIKNEDWIEIALARINTNRFDYDSLVILLNQFPDKYLELANQALDYLLTEEEYDIDRQLKFIAALFPYHVKTAKYITDNNWLTYKNLTYFHPQTNYPPLLKTLSNWLNDFILDHNIEMASSIIVKIGKVATERLVTHNIITMLKVDIKNKLSELNSLEPIAIILKNHLMISENIIICIGIMEWNDLLIDLSKTQFYFSNTTFGYHIGYNFLKKITINYSKEEKKIARIYLGSIMDNFRNLKAALLAWSWLLPTNSFTKDITTYALTVDKKLKSLSTIEKLSASIAWTRIHE